MIASLRLFQDKAVFMSKEKVFTPLNVAVLTVSDSRTLAEDTSGQYLVDSLQEAGHNLADRQLITDDIYKIRAVIVIGLPILMCMQ